MNNEQSITQKLTEHAKKSLLNAKKIAHSTGDRQIKPEHLLYSIFLERGCVGSTILSNMKLTKKHFEKNLFTEDKKPTAKKTSVGMNASLKNIITDAYTSAAHFGYPYVGTEHLVYALLDAPSTKISKILTNAKKPPAKKTPNTQHSLSPEMLAHIGNMLGADGAALMQQDNRDGSALDQFATDLSDTLDDKVFIGYRDVIDRITTILGRKTKNNPVLIGNPGVGKTALIEHIALLARTPDAPAHIRGKKIFSLDLALLVAGTSFRGEFEQRLKEVIAEAQDRDDIVLFVDEIHTIIGTGNTGGSLDAANILKPGLARGTLRMIGATTFDEYKKHIEKDAALSRRFQKVTLNEPTVAEATKILVGAKKYYETHHRARFTRDALRAAVTLSTRFIQEQSLPDKAFDLIDETAARLNARTQNTDLYKEKMELEHLVDDLFAQKETFLHEHKYDAASTIQKQENQAKKRLAKIAEEIKTYEAEEVFTVDVTDIAETLADMTQIPRDIILQKPHENIAKAHASLTRKIIGQKDALTKITQTLMRSATGISDESRPHGSFLLLGPTGVGKTMTAQTLAREIYGSDDALIRVDMSELMEKHQASKLLGAPAGYVGYGEGGTLTEKIRRKPYSIVLFDEIEKAHPDIFNLLLQVLEDGTLTDGEGRTADFRHAIIILTSNIGTSAATMAPSVGFEATQNSHSKNATKAVHELLPPELLSRLDHIITYNTLTQKDLTQITRNELTKVKARLKNKGITLAAERAVAQHIATHSTAEGTGNARNIRKYIQDNIEHLIADRLLAQPETTTLTISYTKKGILTIK